MNTVPFAKSVLKEALLTALDEEINAALNAARQAQETASHEANKPENKYDTLALEAAYLAHGQSERIRELQETRIRIGQWPVPDFSDDDAIAAGALLQLQHPQQEARWLWLAPVGGRQLQVAGQSIQVISLQAPLAQQLSQLEVGDELTLNGQPGWEISALH
ncbi:hypothetical protein [Thalassolituus hydrocarboniclasticus]|uniref:Transcription elongation factor GreAB n=1 Tax=Thalassolituus hydrocarboniclasticus TaxID=2742796 RepID=A0ABY6ABP5_9GAMM|nr:hypothetical protein [Thalassolituus hydrocarboniclasticus]UXD88125.1 transcription elongation factor GreAB [Thalassolituus hydrocarboniclasticus]